MNRNKTKGLLLDILAVVLIATTAGALFAYEFNLFQQ